MSGSRTQLEQILELLLNEDDKKAEELLHEYVVAKAREEYEKVLDEGDDWEDDEDVEDYADEIDDEEIGEAEDDEEEEPVDQTNDFEDDVVDTGDNDTDVDMDDEDDHHADVGGEEDFEDRVDDLEAELEDLRAEFERLMGGEEDEFGADMGDDMGDIEGAEGDEVDMDMDAEDDEVMDSVEYDLDEAVEEDLETEILTTPTGNKYKWEYDPRYDQATITYKGGSFTVPYDSRAGVFDTTELQTSDRRAKKVLDNMGDFEGGEDAMGDVVDQILGAQAVEEATQFSQKTSEQPMKGGNLKGSEADNTKSPYTDAPKPASVGRSGEPVRINDGGEGKKDHGGSVKHDKTHHNMNVKPKGAPKAKDGKTNVDGSNKTSPLTKVKKPS